MKGLTLICIFLLIFWRLTSQTIFDIEIDDLYIDEGNLLFINNGEINTYECDYFLAKVKDFQFDFALSSCDESNDWIDKMDLGKIQEIKSFKKPVDLLRWIRAKRFGKETNSGDSKLNSYFQYFNEHLFAEIDFRNYNPKKPNWGLSKVEFWDYVFLRINGKHLIIALVEKAYENFDYTSIEGFLIPTNSGMTVILEGHEYEEQGIPIDTIRLEKYIPLESYYRVKKVSSGYQLFDRLFQEQIIEKTYNKMKLGRNFIFCEDTKGVTIYDKSASKIIANNLVTVYDSIGSLQCIKDNSVRWLDYDGVFHDTFRIPEWGLCGTISSTERKVYRDNISFYESYVTGYFGQKEKRDSILIEQSDSISSLYYLNNKISHSFDEYSDLNSVFSFPYSYYIVKTNSAQQLVNVTNKRDARVSKFKLEHDYWGAVQTKKDSINTLIQRFGDEIEVELKFEGEFESFGYNHPIRFKEGNLFGYFPQNATAIYTKLEKFNFFLAEFEKENGQKGWLDIYGNEFYK